MENDELVREYLTTAPESIRLVHGSLLNPHITDHIPDLLILWTDRGAHTVKCVTPAETQDTWRKETHRWRK